jgi:hypothetical protein
MAFQIAVGFKLSCSAGKSSLACESYSFSLAQTVRQNLRFGHTSVLALNSELVLYLRWFEMDEEGSFQRLTYGVFRKVIDVPGWHLHFLLPRFASIRVAS